jgi:hypothetical protein
MQVDGTLAQQNLYYNVGIDLTKKEFHDSTFKYFKKLCFSRAI